MSATLLAALLAGSIAGVLAATLAGPALPGHRRTTTGSLGRAAALGATGGAAGAGAQLALSGAPGSGPDRPAVLVGVLVSVAVVVGYRLVTTGEPD